MERELLLYITAKTETNGKMENKDKKNVRKTITSQEQNI